MAFLMQARDSITLAVFTWISATPAFNGAGYPGPNTATKIVCLAGHVDPAGAAGPGGSASTLQRNNGAGGFGGTDIAVADVGGGSFAGVSIPVAGGYVSIGVTPSSVGVVRLANSGSNPGIAFRGAGAYDVWGARVDGADNLIDGDATRCANRYFDIKTGGTYFFRVNGTDELALNATQLDAKNNNILTTGFLSVGTSAAPSGTIRLPHDDTGIAARTDANGTMRLIRAFSSGDLAIVGDNLTCLGLYYDVATGAIHHVRVNNIEVATFGATSHDFKSIPFVGVASINGCTVVEPVEGTTVTTTATINVSQGNVRRVSAASAYSLTLGTTGSPFVDECIWLYCLTALANAITIVNGGAGAGNIGFSAGTIPAGFKGMAGAYRFDGTNWSRVAGSVYRVP